MRFVFKTDYDADINWFRHPAQMFWYGLLLLIVLALPLYFVWTGNPYLLGEITAVLIFSIVGMGLMLLVGQTGLASLGHAAFMAMGCYANILLLNAGVPWLIAFPLAGLIAGVVGTIIALPVLRLHGVYLALATLAMSILTGDFIVLGEEWTGGVAGIVVPDISIFGYNINKYANPFAFYYVVLVVVLVVLAAYRNILRAPSGRAFAAIRDSEISARAMGINPTKTKAGAFFLSCVAAGWAGALFGHSATYVTHETFDIVMSITLLLMIVIGGLGLHPRGVLRGDRRGHHSRCHRQFARRAVAGLRCEPDHSRSRKFRVRSHRDGLHPAGTDGSVWPLAENPHLLRTVPLLPEGHVQAAEKLPEDGACPVSLLEIKNATQKFGGVVAVNDVSLHVNEGEVFALVGPNGAGKSTVFNLISRFYTPVEGSITFRRGKPARPSGRRHRQARRGEDVPEHRTVRERLRAAEPARRSPPA